LDGSVAWPELFISGGDLVLRRNRWLGLVVAAILAGTTACGGGGNSSGGDPGDANGGADKSSESQGDDQGDAAAGLEDVPDVVAEVNGEEIAKADFVEAYEAQAQQAAAQQAQTGQKLDEAKLRKQVAESLVTNELLIQEADRRNITATDRQVQQTLTDLARQNGLKSADQFVEALEQQGMEREDIQTQAATQTKLTRLVSDEAGDVSASDKEVRAMYQQLKAQQEAAGAQGGQAAQQIPPLAQVRPQIEQQVEQQKESEAAQALIGKLRKDADITINV
jgi:hypothetical protein